MTGLKTLFFLSFLFISYFSYSQIKLPKLISDGMALQRDTRTKLWGEAFPLTPYQ